MVPTIDRYGTISRAVSSPVYGGIHSSNSTGEAIDKYTTRNKKYILSYYSFICMYLWYNMNIHNFVPKDCVDLKRVV